MINRSHRFHGFNALKPVYARGQTVRGPLIAIKFLPSVRRSSYRAAVVVSRKVHKSAVVRNRIRRRIYEIIRRHEAAINRPYDLVLTVFSEQVAVLGSSALEAMIVDQLRRAQVLGKSASRTSQGNHGIVEQSQPKEQA